MRGGRSNTLGLLMIAMDDLHYLGVDFGEKRVGVACGSKATGMALPLTTLQRTNDLQLIKELTEQIAQRNIACIVLGLPLSTDGSETDFAGRVRSFAKKLRHQTRLEVEFVAEALTSHEARRRLQEQGVDWREDPGRIDQLAAQLILQEFLDRNAARATAATETTTGTEG